MFVVFSLLFPVLLGLNHGIYPFGLHMLNNRITIITFIRTACVYPLNKIASLGTIRCGTCCDKHSDRHTMRIHGQMYL